MLSYQEIMTNIKTSAKIGKTNDALIPTISLCSESTAEGSALARLTILNLLSAIRLNSREQGEKEIIIDFKQAALLMMYAAYLKVNEFSPVEVQQLDLKKDLQFYLDGFFSIVKLIDDFASNRPGFVTDFENYIEHEARTQAALKLPS